MSSPHTGQYWPQSTCPSSTQTLSQVTSQQKGSPPQTHSVSDGSSQPIVPLASQQSPSHVPQSARHVAQSSPASGSQIASPHSGQYRSHSSCPCSTHSESHSRSQQYESAKQTHAETSPSSQPGEPFSSQQSPWQLPQSRLQVPQFSPMSGSQVPSPQSTHTGQSSGQVAQLSPALGSQLPSPHCGHASPHSPIATSTHRPSHSTSQQNASVAQVQVVVSRSSQPIEPLSSQQPPSQAPQSSEHVAQSSPLSGWQAPSPQKLQS